MRKPKKSVVLMSVAKQIPKELEKSSQATDYLRLKELETQLDQNG